MTFTVTDITKALTGVTFSTYVFGYRGFNFIVLPGRYAANSDVVPRGGGPSMFRLVHTGDGGLRDLPRRVVLVVGGLPMNCFHSLRVVGRMFLPTFSRLGSYLRVTTCVVGGVRIGRRVLSSPHCSPVFSIRRMGRLTTGKVPFHSTCGAIKLRVRTKRFGPGGSVRRARRKDVNGLYGSGVRTLVRRALSRFRFRHVRGTRGGLLGWGDVLGWGDLLGWGESLGALRSF